MNNVLYLLKLGSLLILDNFVCVGVVVVGVMLIMIILVMLVMILVWKLLWFVVFFFLMVFGFIEGVYFIVVCVKVLYGGWVFFVIVLMFFVIFFCWNYGRWIKYLYEVSYKISFDNLGVLIFSMGI